MKIKLNKSLLAGVGLTLIFTIWTIILLTADVKPVGVNGTDVGLSTINVWFHSFTGVNMSLYFLTDWLGLVPVFACLAFGLFGVTQLIKRRGLLKVDFDIIILGIYYVIIILCYLLFETVPVNYRPILINGFMEASYPSSTTLLVLGVMSTVVFQFKRRIKPKALKAFLCAGVALFSVFMVLGRLISGVHWLTDIFGSCLLSFGLYYVYKGIVLWNLTKSFKN